jgi:hypothetical protein
VENYCCACGGPAHRKPPVVNYDKRYHVDNFAQFVMVLFPAASAGVLHRCQTAPAAFAPRLLRCRPSQSISSLRAAVGRAYTHECCVPSSLVDNLPLWW